ncbi:MAG: hypothetical protein A2958_00865 [Candidatus Levybacteria bacterium RIFCSPLOWO2_01_FULL_38_13]|nr:MAG: hypothetical protein A2629_00760 [Candidatus Levybacteria bacterium RIFCSPHIGHO2_01_FULL_41_15]OGH34839.1 MAG: hypothetical protein A2958_00865 [Candidatus Levybacteria bacterium RIFCSPLOWO2_01_FULL_38_13]
MRGFFDEAGKDKIITGGFLITFFLILLSFSYILINLSSIPSYIPLFNQLPWGEERLGTTFMIFLPTGGVLLISFVNLVVSVFIYSKSQMIARMLAITSLLIAFLSFIFIVRTINLIT